MLLEELLHRAEASRHRSQQHAVSDVRDVAEGTAVVDKDRDIGRHENRYEHEAGDDAEAARDGGDWQRAEVDEVGAQQVVGPREAGVVQGHYDQ